MDHVAKKVLESDLAGSERYDYISTFFTIDHQHHVDPNPENLVRRMARLDRRIGRILQAVERSKRRDHTLVVLISDHGSEYLPGAINVTFPLTRAMRTRLFGGHTVGTVMAENAVHALTTPVQGIDFARVYEGPYSPYNQGPGAEKGYTTAFVDNFGNARAEIHLRNNDLNRLHLLLQARYRKLDEQHRVRLRKLLRAALAEVWEWLEPELAAYRDYSQGVRAWLPELKRRADSYWRDVAARLGSENERDTAQLRRLDRLSDGNGTPTVLGLILLLRKDRAQAAPDWRSVITLFIYMAFFSFAYLSLAVGTGALVLFGCVQLTMFIVALKSGENFSAISWAGLALAMAGLIYLVSPGLTAPNPLGAGLMAIAGIAWGLYSLIGRSATDPVRATAYNFIYSVPLVIVTSLIFIADLQVSMRGASLAAASGAIASSIGYVIWYAALRGLRATSAATVQLSAPVIAAIGGVILLSEEVTPRLLFASAATLGGIALVLGQRADKGSN